MRQSLSVNPSGMRPRTYRTQRWASGLIWGATAISALVLVLAFVDQTGNQSLYAYTESAYARHGVTPDPGLVYAIVYAVTITTTLLWALMIPLSRLRGWWAPALNATAAIITGAIALLMLSSAEYGERIFSPVWGSLILVPAMMGLIATVLLVRRARR